MAVVLSAVAALLLPTTGAGAAADEGQIGIRLVEAPANRSDDPRASVYIVDHLAPGADITRAVEVFNRSDTPRTIELFPTAALIRDGGFVPDPATTTGLVAWTSISPSSVDLAPQSSATVQVSVNVPRDAVVGEQYAVAWAAARGTAPSSGGVTLSNRVGVRLYVDVGSGSEPPSDFTVDSLTAQRDASGAPVVSAQVRNSGGRALDMSGSLQLEDGPGLLTAGPFPATMGTTLAPGDDASVSIPLSASLPDGPWKATLTLRSGTIERSVTATLTFPGVGGSTTVPVDRSFWDRYWWAAVGGVVLLGLAAAAVWWLTRSRRPPARRPRPPRPYAEV